MGKPLIMGRNTWESIGRPLPGRANIVLTRDRDFDAAGCEVAHSIEQALQLAGGHQEVMSIGGARLYAQMMDKADCLYLTLVKADIEGDVRFPEIDPSQWQETERASFQADERNEYNYEFVVLGRLYSEAGFRAPGQSYS